MKKVLSNFFSLALILVTTTVFYSCTSDVNDEVSNEAQRRVRALTLTQNDPNNSTRSSLIDKGNEGLFASWKSGDEVSLYNINNPNAGFVTGKATSSSITASFVGYMECGMNDVVRFFYPRIGSVSSINNSENDGNLILDISSQKGTLNDIQQNFDFNYGEATVTSVTEESAVASIGTTSNLMSICKFTIKGNGNRLNGIKSVDISGVSTTATFAFTGSGSPVVIPSTANGTIHIDLESSSSDIYVALFPGQATPTFSIQTESEGYSGKLSSANLERGKFYCVDVEVTFDKHIEGTFIDFGGIKWAKGNLIYDSTQEGTAGFKNNWRIAPCQSYYLTAAEFPELVDNFNAGFMDERNWTLLGNKNVWWNTSLSGKDFSGKLYDQSSIETDFDNAVYGDLAYYVSNGLLRTPTKEDFDKLLEVASVQYGYYIEASGRKVFGMLFYKSDGEKVSNYDARLITNEEMRTGLFFPFGGYRQRIYYYRETDLISSWNTGSSHPDEKICYYMAGSFSSVTGQVASSRTFKDVSVNCMEMYVSESDSYVKRSAVKIVHYDQFTNNNMGQSDYWKWIKIRPVLCE